MQGKMRTGDPAGIVFSVLALVGWLLLLLAIAGCGATPYADVGVGYKLNADYPLLPEHAGGRNPTAHIELGLEWQRGITCGVNHWSHWLDGVPFNHRAETYKNELLCTKRFGGLK